MPNWYYGIKPTPIGQFAVGGIHPMPVSSPGLRNNPTPQSNALHNYVSRSPVMPSGVIPTAVITHPHQIGNPHIFIFHR